MKKFEQALKKIELIDESGAIALKGGFAALSMESQSSIAAGNVNVDVSGWYCSCECDGKVIEVSKEETILP